MDFFEGLGTGMIAMLLPSITSGDALNVELRAIGSHYIERKKISFGIDGRDVRLDENVGIQFPWRPRQISQLEEPCYRRRNRSVIKHSVDYGVLRNPGRDENGRHPNTQSIELELQASPCTVWRRRETVRGAVWRRNMVEDSAVFVIENKQGRTRPDRRITLNMHIHFGNQKFPGLYVVIRVLVARHFFPFVRFVILIVRLDKGIVRQ